MSTKTKIRRDRLANVVREVAQGCRDVEGISETAVHSSRGGRKVKIPDRWPIGKVPTTLSFTIFDGDNGGSDIIVTTRKPWAIRGRIQKQLRQRDIAVC